MAETGPACSNKVKRRVLLAIMILATLLAIGVVFFFLVMDSKYKIA
jgi:hypothetical protein